MAELQLRLQRLPDGHPSSPYNDDGTRKTPVVRLKDLELPLPGEERPSVGGAKHDLSEPYGSESPADRHETGNFSDADDPGATSGGSSDADHRRTAARDQRLGGTSGTKPGSPDDLGGPGGSDRPEPQNGPDGSWEWKGLKLNPEQCRIADAALDRCRAAEGRSVFDTYGEAGLTPAMRRIEAQLEHGRLVPQTEEYALKSPDRFKEKLARLVARFPGTKAESLTADIYDGIRYTFLFEGPHYADGIPQTSRMLENAGYELIELRPSWGENEYKGINSRWRDPTGRCSFEVQWHTPESWNAKQKTHSAYEKINDVTTPLDEVERLRAYQRDVSVEVPVPPGATLFRPYKKEARHRGG